ncbi:hypothetical protein BST33_13125 [Mycolicibacter minnesotensis]|uniref:Uncharacterized protein n=1 Tax=Mycolicibacter minnesotensis TaxID=1118379 RepID=A0A7I7R2M4_9MYCO|nr:outer membrane porin GjpA [Mycolicibacter minnesotensis]ORA99719.1 hypothetical protein BST33_13125 [Mycolicibacter minnesotensis]BBY32891.1 hypothetical protein MMIN_09520 [Mycolicibacter minnesotensis]
MNQALRPFVTAGIALVGASTLAIAPVAPPPPGAPVVHDVELTAGAGFFDLLQDTLTNGGNLSLAFANANDALVEAIQGNPDWWSTSPQELLGALTFLAGDQKGFLNPLAEFTTSLPSGEGGIGSPDFFLGNFLLYGLLSNQGEALAPGLIPEIPAPIPEIVQFLASPLSGILIGAISPAVAPFVALINSIESVINNLGVGGGTTDLGQALSDLISIPANVINGFLNGATLNLDALIPLLDGAGLLPEGVSIGALSFAFGGLLSPGEVGGNLDALTGDELPPITFGGGSILNALGITISVTDPLTLDLTFGPGQGVGLSGALIGLEQVLALLFTGDLDFDGPPPEVLPDPGAATDFDFGALWADLFGGA